MSFGSWWNQHVTQPLKRLAPIIIPVIEIFAPEFIPFVGTALGATTTAGAISAGTAAISAATSALSGASPEEIAKGAVLGGIGGAAGSTAQQASGLTGAAGAAVSGAASGGTTAALTGKDVVSGALKGGATAGLSKGLQEGYQSLLTPTTDYSIVPPDSKSGLGLKASTGTGTDLYAPTGFTAGESNITAPSTDTSSTGIQTSGFSSDTPISETPGISATDKKIADYIAKYSVNKLSPAGSTAGSPAGQPAGGQTSDVATGSQSSPQAAGAADIAILDTAGPEGISGKAAKKGGKYPWGDPEGTTALKQEGQVI